MPRPKPWPLPWVVITLSFALLSCAPAPLFTLRYPAPDPPVGENLVVLLPGIWDAARDFELEGFVRIARELRLPADVVAVDATLGYYLNESVTRRLKQDIVEPAKRRGYRRIWLVGISLGGLGALLYTRDYPQDVAGVIALSPYLGRAVVTREIREAGGLRRWRPGKGEPRDWERPFWCWLRETGTLGRAPPIYVAYGDRDRFAESHRLLAAELPADHTLKVDGDHDWNTWRRLWRQLLRSERWAMFPPIDRALASPNHHSALSSQ